MRSNRSLNGEWLAYGKNEKGEAISFKATVPGCVHTDLLRCGIIKDIFYRDNSNNVQWIENTDFTYERVFSVDKLSENAYIEFDGADTYCDVYLNGRLLGHENSP